MGECLIMRRGGESYELPVLDASYPKDAAVTASPGGSVSFSVRITTPGRPAEYTYQWYRNGAAISGANGAALTLTGLTTAATYSVYCKVTNKAGSVNSRAATLTVRSYLPAYTYSGSAQLIDDGNYNWRLKLLTSGKLTFSHLGSGASAVDVFLVGGGGGGWYGPSQGGGGGGGYTATSDVALAVGTEYSIVVGAGGNQANGGDTKAMGVTASGGKRGGPAGFCAGGSGGGYAGGNGGSDGSDGGPGGQGQGTTTREFGEASGALYAGGGGGGKADRNPPGGAPGGDGGGGHGGWGGAPTAPAPGTPNTGGGGGGNYSGDPGAGGSGIVIIRNHR